MAESRNDWPVDVETLTAPISRKRPVGEALRYDPLYDQIRAARRADDPTLPQGVWKAELKQADWPAIEQLCRDALTSRTKDLQLAAWLLEAWLHRHGVAGVTSGLTLIRHLCEKFWATIYPAVEGEDLTARLAPIRWLNEKVALQLKQIAVTQPRTRETPTYTWVDRENALRLENLTKNSVGKAPTTGGVVTQARFRESVMLSPSAFYVDLDGQLRAALAATAALQASLATHCGEQAPTLAQFTAVLLEMQRMVTTILQERNEGEAPSGQTPAPNNADWPATGPLPIRSRDAAYQLLAEIADYLLRVEPHSPTPYLIKRAVAWGGMALTDLLLELVQSQNDRHAIFALLGVKDGKAGNP